MKIKNTDVVEAQGHPDDLESNIVNIHSDVKYQTVGGIGGAFTDTSAAVWNTMPNERKEEFLKAYFSAEDGIGYNFGRLSIASCDFSREDYEFKLELLCFGIGLVVFFLMRYVMIASGLFPPLFPLRFLKNWRWYISYYGVTYYGEEVDQITAYYKQNNMPAAAEAFARLTNTDICEAREAINMWYAISGEGLV